MSHGLQSWYYGSSLFAIFTYLFTFISDQTLATYALCTYARAVQFGFSKLSSRELSWAGRAELFQSVFFAAPVSDERLCDVSIMILAGCLTPDIDWLRQGGPAWLAMICLPARVRKYCFIIIVLCHPSLSTYFNVKIPWKLRCGVCFDFHIIYNSYLIEYDLPATNSDVHGTVHLQI